MPRRKVTGVAPLLSEEVPETDLWSADGSGGDVTELMTVDYLPTGSSETREAWSDVDDDDGPILVTDASWRASLAAAAPILFVVAVVATVMAVGGWLWVEHRNTAHASVQTTMAPVAGTPSPGPVYCAPYHNVDVGCLPVVANDDQYVAIALSTKTHLSGAGTAGTQDRADNIALSECKAHGDDLCVVAARRHYGCVEVLYDAAGNFVGGTGPDRQTAHTAAMDKLNDTPTGGGAWCTPDTMGGKWKKWTGQ